MAKPMTKTQLVAALAEKMDSDKKSAGAALDGIIAKMLARRGPANTSVMAEPNTAERP